MGPHIEGYRYWLLELGYTSETARGMLKDIGHLGRWMVAEDVEVGQLNGAMIEDSLIARRSAANGRRVPSSRSYVRLLAYLQSQGLIDPPTPGPLTLVGELVARYEVWLVGERGLAPATVLRYTNLARRFLGELVPVADGVEVVADLIAADVIGFLVRECSRVSVGSAKGRVVELRALLRFLYLKGLTPMALASAVPPVAGWRDTSLPKGIGAPDVQGLLDSCDRESVVGIRDFAILTLVARLGLRSVEVARLELGDLDWRAGEITVRGKARRQDRLPLPSDVGEALSAYLQARPATSAREVFLTCRAPIRAIRPDRVTGVTQRACDRAGLARVGAHRLRHGLATELLARGATLVEVSQVLRHSDLATTAIYAKVDLGALRHVAQPWPGAQR